MMFATRLKKLCQSIASRRRAFVYRLLGMNLEGKVWLEAIEWPIRPACITLGAGVALDRGVTLLATQDTARLVIGARCYINRHTMLDASELLEICEDSMIGPGCYLTDHDHAFGPGIAPNQSPLVTAPTRVGARCWLGAHVTVLKGVTIGDGTVVGAGSVVTRSLPAGVIAAGVPAKILKNQSSTPA